MTWRILMDNFLDLNEAEEILNQLVQIYRQYNMREWLNNNSLPTLSVPIPIIICSEALE